jgi:hypothetical protein
MAGTPRKAAVADEAPAPPEAAKGDPPGRPPGKGGSVGPPDTDGERAVAGLLFYKELDCLVDLAHLVSLDFFDRPQLYRDVPDTIVGYLAALRARYGCDEEFLSRDQRREIFVGVFGDETAGVMIAADAAAPADSFPVLRDRLLVAAAAWGERVYNTSADLLRATVRLEHVRLKNYLTRVTGASVQWSRNNGLAAITEGSYGILRNSQIAARFAADRAPSGRWPMEPDGDGSTLVEQISSTKIRGVTSPISRGAFDFMQEVAIEGARALVEVIDYQGEQDADRTDRLITACYQWYAARGRVLGLPAILTPPPIRLPVGAAEPAGLVFAPMDGNRSLYGAAPSAIPGRIS